MGDGGPSIRRPVLDEQAIGWIIQAVDRLDRARGKIGETNRALALDCADSMAKLQTIAEEAED